MSRYQSVKMSRCQGVKRCDDNSNYLAQLLGINLTRVILVNSLEPLGNLQQMVESPY